MSIDNAPGLGFVMKEIYVFIFKHDDGDESVPAFLHAGHTWHPLVAADPARLESYREVAKKLARESGKEIRLVKFTAREEIEVIKP